MRHRNKEKTFWNREYKKQRFFSLSEKPSEDLIVFARWLERNYGKKFLNERVRALDLGCGNGRNLIYLSKTFGVQGLGYDISPEAIAEAKRMSRGLPIRFEVRSIEPPLSSLENGNFTVVLDMMASHVLPNAERLALRSEIARVLEKGGWLFLKTFLRDGDFHAERLLKQHGTSEHGAYVDPKSGIVEHVFFESELREEISHFFLIHEVKKSHQHVRHGRPFKRRSVSIYAQKI